jgi:hypothetical protein
MIDFLKIKALSKLLFNNANMTFLSLVMAVLIFGSCQSEKSDQTNNNSCTEAQIDFNLKGVYDVQSYLTEKFNILLGSSLCLKNKTALWEAISSQTTKNIELVFNVRGELKPTTLVEFRKKFPNDLLSVDEIYIKRENNSISKISIYVSEIKNPISIQNKIPVEKSEIKNELSQIKGFAGEIDGEFVKIEITGYNDQYNIILFKYTAIAEGLEHFNKSGKIYPNSMEIYFESFKKSKLKLTKTSAGFTIVTDSVNLKSF